MNVEVLMKRDIGTCLPQDTLNEVCRLMWGRDCGSVPVLNDEGRLVGMVTDRDVCMAAYTQGRLLGDIPVAVIMTSGVVTCRPGDSIAEAEDRMRCHQLHRLAVVDDDGLLVGLLTLSDLAREAALEGGHWRLDVTANEVVETLAAIVSPRTREAPRGVA